MKRKVFLFAGCLIAAMLLFLPAASHAKRGMPEYVVEKSCGDNNTGPSVLIAFATDYGSTYKIADVVARVLCEEDFVVALKFADNVTQSDLDGYDAVILGSNIYIEEWHADALAFLEDYEDTLAAKSVAYFCVNGLLGMNFAGKEAIVEEHYVSPMYDRFPQIVPKDIAAFAGAVDYRILNLKDWLMLRLMFMPRGNWTNYAEVVSWAYEVSEQLK